MSSLNSARKLRIVCQPPVDAPHTLICRGDEATVSRLGGNGPYAGMVERRQEVTCGGRAGSGLFMVSGYRSVMGRLKHWLGASDVSYHLAKCISLGLAGTMFPGRFVQPHELRFFNREGALHAAVYSPFVADGNEVMERRRTYMERFYATSKDTQWALRTDNDAQERRLNPELAPLVKRMNRAGLGVAHPEANYHLTDKGTIFFELAQLDVKRVLKAARADANEEAATWLAVLAAVLLKGFACRRAADYRNLDETDRVLELTRRFAAIETTCLFGVVWAMMNREMKRTDVHGQKIRGEEMVWKWDEMVKNGYRYWQGMTSRILEKKPAPAMPIEIEERVFEMNSH